MISPEDQQLLQRALQRLQTANEIVGFVSAHLRDKYGLTAANQITPDGRIVGPEPNSKALKNQLTPELERAIRGDSEDRL